MNVKVDLKNPEYYLNRELSLLNFYDRVLSQARDTSLPLLERLAFILICSANLDEFYEIRVANLKQKRQLVNFSPAVDGLSIDEVLKKISLRTHELVAKQYDILNHELCPLLAKANIHFIPQEKWTPAQAQWIKNYFRTEVLPLLSPIGLDLAHPFPRLVNKSLNFLVSLDGKDAFGRDSGLAVVHAPRSLPRLIRLPNDNSQPDDFVYLSAIIEAHAHELFPGMTVTGCYKFRLTRNSDLLLEEESIVDLAHALKNELFARRYGTAVRLELAANCPKSIADFLLDKHKLTEEDLFLIDGQVNLSRYRVHLTTMDRPDLKFADFIPGLPKVLKQKRNMFDILRDGDVLLNHPYESFTPVVDFIRQAAHDPDVLAIKSTLYRTGTNSPMVRALIEAARAGKEVTAVVELRARFDEEDNLELANRLHEAGALVVYGVLGFKTHAKMTLIVRREQGVLRRYAHLGTGNYHAHTTLVYSDYGLLTYNPDITSDVQNVFQQLTGMGKLIKLKKLLHAPFTLYDGLIDLIAHEAEAARAGKPAYIMAKMNSLTEPKIIRALYSASQAGVKIDLIVRGSCCLRPGVPDVSENIRVRSIVGRFLEHSRIYYFLHDGEEKLFCASADLMERNLFRRVEVCFPIEDKLLRERIKKEALLYYLEDNCQAWELQADGSYQKVQPTGKQHFSAQQALLDHYAER